MHKLDTPGDAKGWYVGPWNSQVPVAIGYANDATATINHRHEHMNEVHLVFVIQTPFVKGDKVELEPVVDPGP